MLIIVREIELMRRELAAGTEIGMQSLSESPMHREDKAGQTATTI